MVQSRTFPDHPYVLVSVRWLALCFPNHTNNNRIMVVTINKKPLPTSDSFRQCRCSVEHGPQASQIEQERDSI